MSILGLFDIGRTSLLTNQRALNTTGHNVANSSTPGYTRQDVVLSSIPSGGFIVDTGSSGRGVTISGIQRMYDSFTSLQLITEKSNLSYWNAFQSGVTNIENTFNEATDTGISTAIAGFFNAWQEVSQDPGSYAQRTTLLNQANELATRINRAAVAMDDSRQGIFQSSQTLVTEANTMLQQISDLNEKIAANPGGLDLKDQRDQLIESLNQIVKVTTFDDGSGRTTVMMGGTPLVAAGSVFKLSAGLNADNTMHFYANLPDETRDITNLLSAGELKANLDVRDTFIVGIQNKLNVFAIDLADQVNYYHRAGYALDSTTGNNFFGNLATTSTTSVAGSISSVNVTNASAFNYDQFSISYNAMPPAGEDVNDFTIMNNTTGLAVTAGISYTADTSLAPLESRTISFNGIAVKIDGALVNGESFTAQLDKNAARDMAIAISDPSKIAAASGDYVVISSSNNVIRFSENGGNTFVSASLPNGTYTRQQLATALQSALTSAGSGTQGYTVTYNAAAKQYTIDKTSAGTVVFDWASTTSTAKGLLGFTASTTLNGVSSATSTVAVLPKLPNDNGNAGILYNLFNQTVIAGNKPSDFYQSIVSDVGVTSASAKTSASVQGMMVDQLEQRRQEISGVNLDEEAANLIKFQKTYEASAKMISIADQLLATLLNMTGRQLS